MKQYSVEFKQEVREFAMQNPSMSMTKLAEDFGVPIGTLHGWLKGKGMPQGTTNKAIAQSQDIIAARKRIRELEEENLILKRAAAYFAGEMRPK